MSDERKEHSADGRRGWTRFEDLIAWRKARELTQRIYQVSVSADFSRDYGLRDQARRAAVSIMSNIAEGLERGSQAEFHRFLMIAKGSCAELRSQLYVALDAGYLQEEQFITLLSLAEETSRVIGGLRLSVRDKRARSG